MKSNLNDIKKLNAKKVKTSMKGIMSSELRYARIPQTKEEALEMIKRGIDLMTGKLERKFTDPIDREELGNGLLVFYDYCESSAFTTIKEHLRGKVSDDFIIEDIKAGIHYAIYWRNERLKTEGAEMYPHGFFED
jgi:hypothetical protein